MDYNRHIAFYIAFYISENYRLYENDVEKMHSAKELDGLKAPATSEKRAAASVERVKAAEPLSARLYPVGDGNLTATVVRSSVHTPAAHPSSADVSALLARAGAASTNQAMPASLKRALDRALSSIASAAAPVSMPRAHRA